MPELKWPWAYPALWGVMLVIGGGMIWIFRRKKWLWSLRTSLSLCTRL